MASISYEEIFSSFLGNVTDYNLASLSPTDAFEIMSEYLHKSVADPYMYRLFSEYSLDDEGQVLSYTLSNSVNDETDKEFVINALAKWMVYEWLNKQVQSVVNITQMFSNKEQKYYSQAQHITELRGLRDDAMKAARFYIQNAGYVRNSYLGGAS